MKKAFIYTVFWIVLILVGVAGYFNYKSYMKKDVGVEVILASISGEVKIFRNNISYEGIRIGMKLLPSDRIVTSQNSYAVLKIREIGSSNSSSIYIDPSTDSTVGEQMQNAYQFRLDDGRIYGEVNMPIRITTKGDTFVETDKSSFGMIADKSGKIHVGVGKGELKLSSSAGTTIVRNGEQAFAEPGKKPSEPMKIPASMLLKVQWPKEKELNQRFLMLEGRTNSGSRIILNNGQTVVADEQGKFVAKVELNEGVNKLKIEAKDILGNIREAESPEISVDTKPPEGEIGQPIFGD